MRIFDLDYKNWTKDKLDAAVLVTVAPYEYGHLPKEFKEDPDIVLLTLSQNRNYLYMPSFRDETSYEVRKLFDTVKPNLSKEETDTIDFVQNYIITNNKRPPISSIPKSVQNDPYIYLAVNACGELDKQNLITSLLGDAGYLKCNNEYKGILNVASKDIRIACEIATMSRMAYKCLPTDLQDKRAVALAHISKNPEWYTDLSENAKSIKTVFGAIRQKENTHMYCVAPENIRTDEDNARFFMNYINSNALESGIEIEESVDIKTYAKLLSEGADWKDADHIIKKLSNKDVIESIPKEFREDPQFVLRIIKNRGPIQFCTPEMLYNEDILSAVTMWTSKDENGIKLPIKMASDVDLARKQVKKAKWWIKEITPETRADSTVLLNSLEKWGNYRTGRSTFYNHYVPKKLKNDVNFNRMAIMSAPDVYNDLSEKMRYDPNVIKSYLMSCHLNEVHNIPDNAWTVALAEEIIPLLKPSEIAYTIPFDQLLKTEHDATVNLLNKYPVPEVKLEAQKPKKFMLSEKPMSLDEKLESASKKLEKANTQNNLNKSSRKY